MKEGKIIRMGTRIGAAIGGVMFMAFGLIPGVYFGSYGAVAVMNHLLGTAEPTVILRMAAAVGIMLGVLCIAFVNIVMGAILGTAVGYMAEAVRVKATEKRAAAAAVKA